MRGWFEFESNAFLLSVSPRENEPSSHNIVSYHITVLQDILTSDKNSHPAPHPSSSLIPPPTPALDSIQLHLLNKATFSTLNNKKLLNNFLYLTFFNVKQYGD